MFMLTIFIFSILGAVWTINVTVIENQVNGTEQLSVYLPVVVTFPENFLLTWRIGGTQIASLTAGGTPAYWSGYTGRAELYPNNGTLRLDRLQLTDTGDYNIRVVNQNNSDSSEATISLSVHPAAPTVGITVIENPVNGTRGQAAYFLVQISFPTQFQLHWRIDKTGLDIASLLSGATPVYYGPYRGRAQLFPENGTLRLDNLADSDSGGYKVSLFNGDLGTQTEAVLQLNVYTRLYKPIVTITPEIVEQGHKVTFHCNISDGNYVIFSWFKDDQYITCGGDNICSDNSPELVITSVKESDEGNYSCSVKNPVSNNASDVAELKVYVRVTKPVLIVTPPEVKEGDNITLNCSTTVGNHLNYTWYLSDTVLGCSDRYFCNSESSELIIRVAEPADTGNYSCTAENQVNANSSDSTALTVNYGPSDITIYQLPPDKECPGSWPNWFIVPGAVCVNENSNLSMACEAQSVPQSNYSWSWNNGTTDVELSKSSVLNIYKFTNENDGNYSCTASNNITGKKISQLRRLITYRIPPESANISYVKNDEEKVNVSCSWFGGIPAATVHLQHSDGWINGTEEVNSVLPMGSFSCRGQHLFDVSVRSLTLQKPEATNPKPEEVITSDGAPVTLLVTLQSGRKKYDSLQSQNEEVLPANFTWVHPNSEVFTEPGTEEYRINSTVHSSEFVISKFDSTKDKGIYTCTVTNPLGSTDVVFTIQTRQDGANVGLIVGATIGAIAAAVLIGVAIYFIVKYANKHKVQYHNEERQAAAKGNPEKNKAIPLEDTSKQQASKSEDNEIQYAELPVLQKQSLNLPRVEMSNTLYSQIKTG